MRGRGINYDIGFLPGGTNSRPDFDPEVVRREMNEDRRGTAYPDMAWEPKESFHALAAAYAS